MVYGVCVHDLDVHEPCFEVICLHEGNARRQLSLYFEELLRSVSIFFRAQSVWNYTFWSRLLLIILPKTFKVMDD